VSAHPTRFLSRRTPPDHKPRPTSFPIDEARLRFSSPVRAAAGPLPPFLRTTHYPPLTTHCSCTLLHAQPFYFHRHPSQFPSHPGVGIPRHCPYRHSLPQPPLGSIAYFITRCIPRGVGGYLCGTAIPGRVSSSRAAQAAQPPVTSHRSFPATRMHLQHPIDIGPKTRRILLIWMKLPNSRPFR
jgi:hypothetical protein